MKKMKAMSAFLLMVTLIAVPVMSLAHTPTITSISPPSGPVGTTVSLVGEIDTEGGEWQIQFEVDAGEWETVKEGTCDAGSVSVDTTFTVPNATVGDHTIKLKDLTSGSEATTTFSVETAWAVVPTPARQQEGLSVDLTITISGALADTEYNFSITVTDPTGASYANITTITAETDDTGFGSVTKAYPDAGVNFEAGANTNYTGTYNVVVDQEAPEFIAEVATTSFTIGLTDEASYQRTLAVNIRGSGFIVDEEVLINVTDPTDAIVHTDVLTATDGTVEDWWIIPLDAVLGTYTANLTGVQTGIKTPPDLQEFEVTEAVLTVEITDQPPATIQRTLDAVMKFHIRYPDGEFYNTTHLGTIDVSVYCNTTLVTVIPLSSDNYEEETAKWNVTWTIPEDAAIGSGYSFNLTANAVTDPHENSGPAEYVSSDTFAVGEKAVLIVEITDPPEEWYHRTETATMRFNVTYPDGEPYTNDDLGTIRVRVYYGTTWYANVSLTAADFDAATNEWTVRWVVPWDAPLRSDYKFMIYPNEVVDKYGNCGPAETVSSDAFEVVKVVLAVPAIYTDKASYGLGDWVTVYFAATYLDDSPVTTGSATITLIKPDGSTKTLTAHYDEDDERFEARYRIKSADPTGTWTAKLAAHGLEDDAGNTGPVADRERDFEVTPAVPPGVLTVEIHPETLNLKSRGRWITCRIKPPAGYDVEDIDVGTVKLSYNGEDVEADWGNVEGNVLMVKFDRSQVISLLQQAGVDGREQVELTIKAEVNGESFEGTDTIRVISPGRGRGPKS
jgi:hypothetical protein